jgi:hypothetical protein
MDSIKLFTLNAGDLVKYTFPSGFSGYWVRAVSDAETKASVTFDYR